MGLTQSFKDLVQQRVARDPAFAKAFLREGIGELLTGNVETGEAILRGYINMKIGFENPGVIDGLVVVPYRRPKTSPQWFAQFRHRHFPVSQRFGVPKRERPQGDVNAFRPTDTGWLWERLWNGAHVFQRSGLVRRDVVINQKKLADCADGFGAQGRNRTDTTFGTGIDGAPGRT